MANIRIDLKDITGKYSKHLDWNDAENHEVEEAMSNLKNWSEKMMKLRKEIPPFN